MAAPFRSARLLYRAVDPKTDEDLFRKIQSDPILWRNVNINLPRPAAAKDATDWIKTYTEDLLLGLVVCLIPSDAQTKPVPIGLLACRGPRPLMAHHRHAELGIMIMREYQNQGYGTEVLSWAFDWCFESAGMHRVILRSFGFHEGARRLYERLGLKHEGTGREQLFHQGRCWDELPFAILDREWKEIKAAKAQVNGRQA